MSAALADTLRQHGVKEPAASLAAEAGVAVFKVGFERWILADEEHDLSRLMRESLDELKAVTAGGQAEYRCRRGRTRANGPFARVHLAWVELLPRSRSFRS